MTDTPVARVWIYDAGIWRLADDPTGRPDGSPAWEGQEKAGCTPAIRLREGDGAQYLEMATRPGVEPECQIVVTGELGQVHVVYATRLPEGFDLMARWVPLVTKWT